MFWRKKPEGLARITRPLLITYPTVEGGLVRVMFQHIVAVRPNPDGKSTYLDCSNGLTYHIARPEQEVLHDFNGYEY